MLKFVVINNGRPVDSWPLRNAYLMGGSGSAVRGDITFEKGMVVCRKRESGPASLVLQQPLGDCGEMTVQTTLLPERDEPYLLSLELARHRLMLLTTKLEDWQMFDLGADHPVIHRLDLSRRLFFEALCHQGTNPSKADKLAKDCLVTALDGGEELALAHAELLLNRRKEAGVLPKHAVGCKVALTETHQRLRPGLAGKFDLLHVPTYWRNLQPREGEYKWGLLDGWADWAVKNRTPIIAGPVLSFDPHVLPDWLAIFENGDFETLRDMMYEHAERLVGRYREAVSAWNVASGLHANGRFNCSLDQILELTRLGSMVVKKLQPAARTFIEICQPFGEYYARNQQSIPPLTYADLLVQSSLNFDGFVLRLQMGQAEPGQYTRDLLQISNLLDQFAHYSKPVHLVVGVPSHPVTEQMISAPEGEDDPVDANSGAWRRPWTGQVQAHWMEAVLLVAMSKPYVETVSWSLLMDHPDMDLPGSGLVSEDFKAKPALSRVMHFRKQLREKPDAGGKFQVSAVPRQAMQNQPTTAPSQETEATEKNADADSGSLPLPR